MNLREIFTKRKRMFLREFESIREAILDVAQAIKEGNVIAERGRPCVYTEQEVFTELVKTGVDVQLRYRAYRLHFPCCKCWKGEGVLWLPS